MKILAIETSCDESAVSVIEAKGDLETPTKLSFKVRAHLISSQTALHAAWGGVVPSLAKREHARNLVPLLRAALAEAGLLLERAGPKRRDYLTVAAASELQVVLEREPELLEQLLAFVPLVNRPKLNAIAVTQGPGLEPALWVGLNFARALGLVWQLPLVPVNHLEGHLLSTLARVAAGKKTAAPVLKFPLVALIVSGGHTELVLARDWLSYELIGQTRDDAVGEAFDKVARILGLGYPGGPAISQLAGHGSLHPNYNLPRPMLNSPDFDFSFSGLKTAVLYLVKQLETSLPTKLTNIHRADIARQFQQAAIDVLLHKTAKALEKFKPQTLVIGGGVVANEELRRQFGEMMKHHFLKIALALPDSALATDNATMIGVAGYLRFLAGQTVPADQPLAANGNLRLA